MTTKTITNKIIESYREHLINEEKSKSTIEKYIHDLNDFAKWLCEREVTKDLVLKYKQLLTETYSPRSVNSKLSSLNSFFDFAEWLNFKVKSIRIQRQIFASRNRELTKAEYERLLNAAKGKNDERLYYLLQTIASTGLRVSEVKYVTVDAVRCGQATINLKGKIRVVILPKQLCKILKEYIKTHNIKDGSVFVTKSGRPLDRSNIWADMKKLCEIANVSRDKVFPHNLRHLFARTYYNTKKDISRLADILGHSNIETTRIYTMESGTTHKKQIEKLGLLHMQM